MDYIETLAEIATRFDKEGLHKAANALDSALLAVAESRKVLAQYESGMHDMIQNSRCFGNCYRVKRSKSPSKPAQEVWESCWKEYVEMINGKSTSWDKYASTEITEFDGDFLYSVKTKIASGEPHGNAIVSEIESSLEAPALALVKAAHTVTKVASLTKDQTVQATLAHVAAEMIKEAQKWRNFFQGVGGLGGAAIGGFGGGLAGSIAGPAGAAIGGTAGAVSGGMAGIDMGGKAYDGLVNMGQGVKDWWNKNTSPSSSQGQMKALNQFMQFAHQRVTKALVDNPHLAPQQAEFIAGQLRREIMQKGSKFVNSPEASQQIRAWMEDGGVLKLVQQQMGMLRGAPVGGQQAGAAGAAPAGAQNMGPNGAGGANPAAAGGAAQQNQAAPAPGAAWNGDPVMQWFARYARKPGARRAMNVYIARLTRLLQSI